MYKKLPGNKGDGLIIRQGILRHPNTGKKTRLCNKHNHFDKDINSFIILHG